MQAYSVNDCREQARTHSVWACLVGHTDCISGPSSAACPDARAGSRVRKEHLGPEIVF